MFEKLVCCCDISNNFSEEERKQITVVYNVEKLPWEKRWGLFNLRLLGDREQKTFGKVIALTVYLSAVRDYSHRILGVFRIQVGTRMGDTMEERISFVWKAWLCICNFSSLSMQVSSYDGLRIKHCSLLEYLFLEHLLLPQVRYGVGWTSGLDYYAHFCVLYVH